MSTSLAKTEFVALMFQDLVRSGWFKFVYGNMHAVHEEMVEQAYDLCEIAWKKFKPEEGNIPQNTDTVIPWRGSIGDLATDIAFVLTKNQGKLLANELNRLISDIPMKFHRE
jgi:hypothetical protein